MTSSTVSVIDRLILRHPELSCARPDITEAAAALISCYRSGGRLLICGNGGSAADSLHIVSELMKDYGRHRPIPEALAKTLRETGDDGRYISEKLQQTLPAMSLLGESAFITAFENDVAPDMCFAQQVYGYGKSGDALLAISTSGNSRNVVLAATAARALGLTVISLTGKTGGKLKDISHVCVRVPETDPNYIQEAHLPIYHALCLAVENEIFG